MKTDKIFPSIHELHLHLEQLKKDGKRIVLCHGVFDLLHIGHIRYLRQAALLGDILVVTLSPDRFVDKGPKRPAFSEQLRLEAVAALDCVNFAAINEWPTAEETLRLLKPDIYAKGAEFKNQEDATGKINREASAAQEVGTRLEFIDDIVFSSSNLINTYLSSYNKETQDYLDVFRRRHSLQDIISLIDHMKQLKVMIIGDTIIDAYTYCHPLGASSKDPVLALLHQSSESFAGGAVAVANHVAQYVSKVVLVTVMGDDEQEEFIRKSLASNIEIQIIRRPNAPTVKKMRILEASTFQKLMEVYHMEQALLPETCRIEVEKAIDRECDNVDFLIAADFGNGCIPEKTAQFLSAKQNFLAVNTQANAGNRGHHTIGRYSRAGFVSLAAHEILLEYRNQNLSVSDMMIDLKKRLHAAYILVTEGRNGCAVLAEGDFQRAPSFTSSVIDRVGAGDALFSITSLASFLKADPDVIAFLGNIAGSLAVETIGNAKPIIRDATIKYITAVLK